MQKVPKEDIVKLQVSSVIRNDKSFGKKNILDECEDTCWTSSEGSPQWIYIELSPAYRVTGFSVQFQGGFVGQNCSVELRNGEDVSTEPFYPEDINSLQKFTLAKAFRCDKMKFLFEGSTDFFGRVVVYSLDVFHDE